MPEPIRDRLERLLTNSTDSNAFAAGQQEERRRLQVLIAARIDELRTRGSVPHIGAICAELNRIRQALESC